jgi:hypothetical protein
MARNRAEMGLVTAQYLFLTELASEPRFPLTPPHWTLDSSCSRRPTAGHTSNDLRHQ